MNELEREEVKRRYLGSLLIDFRYSIERFDNQSLYIAGGALALRFPF